MGVDCVGKPPDGMTQSASIVVNTKESNVTSESSSQGGAAESPSAQPPAGEQEVSIVVEPMTLSLMGKLFGVPLLIIGSVVGCAVVVVILFGAPASPEARSVKSLLQALEASTWGYREGVVLLPREKEPWQAALELAVRLEKKDAEMSAEELESIADRVGKLVLSDLGNAQRIVAPAGGAAITGPSGRLQFLIQALGRTGHRKALDPLIEVVLSGQEPYACSAIQQLGNLHMLPGSRRAIGPIVSLLSQSPPTETRLMATTALSVLANPDDEAVIDVLSRERMTGEGEVAWSAALALARLGSAEGKITLLDLLDRSFWETGKRYVVRDAAGVVHRYKMPAERVERLLLAVVDAAAYLEDADVWAAIGALKSDESHSVRARAIEVFESRSSLPKSGPTTQR